VALLKIVLVVMLILAKDPFDYEDEYDPQVFARVTAFSGGEL
jgi:hypothetical protein